MLHPDLSTGRQGRSLYLFLLLPALLLAASVHAHVGRLDAQGGHYDRATGEYHCHKPGCTLPESPLPVQPPGAAYQREAWKHWEDFDNDCRNTRQELLAAQSRVPVRYSNSGSCTVVGGEWFDPYTDTLYTDAADLDIDHVIPLNYAHSHGGAAWSPLLKKVFANDPENLLVVQDRANQTKSDKGPAAYLPPSDAYHCEYARLWLHLSRKYELVLASADLGVLQTLRNTCRSAGLAGN